MYDISICVCVCVCVCVCYTGSEFCVEVCLTLCVLENSLKYCCCFKFSKKIGFDISCKLFLWRQFAWNFKAYFLEKKMKSIISLSSAELAQRVVKVKPITYNWQNPHA